MGLEAKGIACTGRRVDPFKPDRMRPGNLALDPGGVVPARVHDGKPIRKARVMTGRFDEASAGPALRPADPPARARMRAFTPACDDGLPATALPTLAKHVLPRLRSRRSEDVLRARAVGLRSAFLRDIHTRGGPTAARRPGSASGPSCASKSGATAWGKLAGQGARITGDFSLADVAVAPWPLRMSTLGETRSWSPGKRPRVAN